VSALHSGLGSIPLLVAGGVALGLSRKQAEKGSDAALDELKLTYACFMTMAEADGRISDEETTILRSVLLQYPLSEEQRELVENVDTEQALELADRVDANTKHRVLQGSWMLAEADGTVPAEDACFQKLAERFGMAEKVRDLKSDAKARQAELNELVTGMFRTTQQVLQPNLGQPSVNAFLESLAQIAATPQTRRSLRNSLKSGFSAGGVVQTLNQHAAADQILAQASNATLAVYDDPTERRVAETRLLDLADSSTPGRKLAKRVHSDVQLLFDEMLSSSDSE
jgi:uncharacterized tellurite resistance protein B-like protein